jgi:hypothetical protein
MTRNRLSFRAAAFGLAFSGLLALTACGGDDKGSSDTKASDTTEATTDTAAGSDDTTASDDTTSSDDTGAATDDTTDTSDIDPLSAEDCKDLQSEFTSVFGATSSDDVDFSQIGEVFDRLKDVVPDDLKGDVETLDEAYSKLADVYDELQDDPTKAASDPAVQEALAGIDTPEVTAASDRLDAFFANCEDAG